MRTYLNQWGPSCCVTISGYGGAILQSSRGLTISTFYPSRPSKSGRVEVAQKTPTMKLIPIKMSTVAENGGR